MIDMNTAANVAEIGGGIAILVSLIYVGSQIRQSNRIAKVEAIRAAQSMEFMDNFDMAAIGRALAEFESIDYSRKWEFHTYFLHLWAHWQVILDSHHLGLISAADLKAWTHVMAGLFITPGVEQYLEGGGREYLMSHGLQVIEDFISENSSVIKPYNQHFKWMIEPG